MRPVLQVACPNRVGLVNAITAIILKLKGDIAEIDQHIDGESETFFMRISWTQPGKLDSGAFRSEVEKIVGPGSQVSVISNETPKRMAILVSKMDHCLVDLLWRVKNNEINVSVPLIISNHADHEKLAKLYDIPYHCLPSDKDKEAQEKQVLALLEKEKIDFVVLARYMQILSPKLIQKYPSRIINIHHSFLPAFAGANPYKQAHERGVKIIGATSHFATEVLDDGPIIAQDTVSISHEHDIEDLKRLGRDIEKKVFSKAVKLYAEDRIFVEGKRTIVFE